MGSGRFGMWVVPCLKCISGVCVDHTEPTQARGSTYIPHRRLSITSIPMLVNEFNMKLPNSAVHLKLAFSHDDSTEEHEKGCGIGSTAFGTF